MENRLSFTTDRLGKLACPPGKGRIYYHDAKTLGLVLCVTEAGAKTFYTYRRINGRPVRYRLGLWPAELSVDGARNRAAEINGDIARGIDPRQARREVRAEMTFGELFVDYLEKHAKVHKKSWDEDQRQYDRDLKKWSGRRLSETGRADVESLHARLGLRGKYQANRTLALIHKIFETARRWGWNHVNPASGVQRFREQSRERYLLADELPRWFAAVDAEVEIFADFFKLALFTGARRSNLESMAWPDVNLDRAEWNIPDTKSGDPVKVHLPAEAVVILRRRAANRNGSMFVFPSRGKTGHLAEPKTAWKRVLARAGITDLRLHDLRRTLGSWQAATGASLPIIGKSLGHKRQETTAIYARLNIDPVREAVDKATAAMVAAGGQRNVS